MTKRIVSALFCAGILTKLAAQPITTVDRTHPLHAQWGWAIYQGDIEWVQELMAKGFKVNAPIAEVKSPQDDTTLFAAGTYPIQLAVSGGNPEMIKYLAKKGANLKIKNNDGESLFHLAFRRPEAIAALLELKQDPTEQDKNGNTVLHIAVGISTSVNAEKIAILELLKNNSKLKKIRNKKRKTAIEQAIEHQNEMAIKILEPGQLAQIERQKKLAQAKATQEKAKEEKRKFAEKQKALAENCGKEGFWLTLKLLEEGMETGDEALVRCAMRKKPKLAQPSMDGRKLHLLYDYGNAKIIDIILAEAPGETLNETTPVGNTFTVLSASFRDKMPARWVQILIKKNVSPDISSRISDAPREIACVDGDDAVFKLLPPTDVEKSWQKGSTVFIDGKREAKILRSCKKGALVAIDGKQSFFANSNIAESRDVPKPISTAGQTQEKPPKKKKPKESPAHTEPETETPDTSNYREAQCLEQCLRRCPAPQFYKKPSYGDEVCRNGCFDSCKSSN